MLSWEVTVISISGYFTQRMLRFVQWLYCNLLIQHTKPVAFSTRCTYIRFWILHVTQWVVVYTPCTWDSLYIYVYLCIFLASLMYLYSSLLVPLILWFLLTGVIDWFYESVISEMEMLYTSACSIRYFYSSDISYVAYVWIKLGTNSC